MQVEASDVQRYDQSSRFSSKRRCIVTTQDGSLVDLLEAMSFRVDAKQVARALSKVCRFSGNASEFYSVAQHSVLVSELCGLEAPEVQMQALVHDASEMFLSDVTSPVKALLPDYKWLERRVQMVICCDLGLPGPPQSEAVEKADKLVCVWERARLFRHRRAVIHTCWDHEEARVRWLAHYDRLKARIENERTEER